MREQFEELPEVASNLHNVVFGIGCGEYLPKKMGYIIHEFSAYYLNGAWYAFQEQQKKIDKLICNHLWTGKSENQYCSKCGEVD